MNRPIEKKFEISYLWHDTENVSDDHEEELNDHAIDRIADMMKEGNVEGELCWLITDDDDTEHDYHGWWKKKRLD